MATVKETFLLTALGALCSAICAATLAVLICTLYAGGMVVRIWAHLLVSSSLGRGSHDKMWRVLKIMYPKSS